MSSLKSLPSSLLTTSQLKNIAIQTMKLTESFIESNDFINDQHVAMGKSITMIDKIHAYSQVNKKTEDFTRADDVLDDVLTGIRDYLKGAVSLRRFDQNKGDAAERIIHHMESYGKELFYGSYDKQADLVPSFVKSVREQYAEDLETAVMAHLIDGLSLASEAVINLYNEKLGAQKKPESTMADEKKVIRYRIDGLLSYLDVRITDAIEAYVPLQETLNELITEVMTHVRANQTRKEHSKAEEAANQ